MAHKTMSKCLLCGNEYEVCKLCRNVEVQTPWRTICDTSRHFQIYMIVKDIRANVITVTEAKDMLKNLHVTEDEVKSFVPSVRDTLKPVFNENTANINEKHTTEKKVTSAKSTQNVTKKKDENLSVKHNEQRKINIMNRK